MKTLPAFLHLDGLVHGQQNQRGWGQCCNPGLALWELGAGRAAWKTRPNYVFGPSGIPEARSPEIPLSTLTAP